jgi:hypothetical protein
MQEMRYDFSDARRELANGKGLTKVKLNALIEYAKQTNPEMLADLEFYQKFFIPNWKIGHIWLRAILTRHNVDHDRFVLDDGDDKLSVIQVQ